MSPPFLVCFYASQAAKLDQASRSILQASNDCSQENLKLGRIGGAIDDKEALSACAGAMVNVFNF